MSTASAPGGSEAILARQRAYLILAAFLLLANLLVLALSRGGTPTLEACAALTLQAVASACAAFAMRFPQRGPVVVARGALVVLVALLAAGPSWFFGPNGPFAGFVAILLLFAGVLAEPGSRRWIGVGVCVALSLSQLAVVALVLSGTVPDRSIVPLFLPGHSVLDHWVGHASIQLIYVTAFVSGSALGRRYAAVLELIAEAREDVALKEALLAEARAEYRRSVRAGRDGSAPVARASTPPPPDAEATEVQRRGALRASVPPGAVAVEPLPATPTEASIPPPDGAPAPRLAAWGDAYRTRKRGQDVLIFALAIIGSGLLGLVGPGPIPVLVGCAGIVSIALLALVGRRGEQLRGPAWAAIGALSVAPAYAVGLHSGFVCVVCTLLFLGSAFEPDERPSFVTRYGMLVGAIVAHAALFAAIVSGAVPDVGNSAVLLRERTPMEPYLLHLAVQALLVLAFSLGRAVDRRHVTLRGEAERAEAAARGRGDELRAADAALRALESQGAGLFSEQVVGPYRLGRVVASGGMGDVYEARPSEDPSGPRVAVKLVRRERVSDPLTLSLFEEEAAALARVSSPYVATVLGIGGRDSELPYLAMELIEGSTLATLLRDRGHLSLDEVRGLVRDLAGGLRAVHAAGIIHRDVKPQNVMLTAAREGMRWKIVDFGVAQLHELAGAGARVLAGTAPYMAPEHALGERMDARADLYALALVVYRALVGRPAFTGEDRVAIAERARRQGPPAPTGEVVLPRAVELVLRISLAADADERFATAAEMRSAFEAAFEGTLSQRLERRGEDLLRRRPWAEPTGRIEA